MGAVKNNPRQKRGVGLLLRDFPLDLKHRIASAADDEDSNFNDVAVQALAREFGVAFTPSGVRSNGVGDSTSVNLEMPPVLRKRINVDGARRELPARTVVLDVLSERFP